MTQIIAFANTKGGVGKSMLATNCAVELFDRGYRVSFMDGEEGSPTGMALKQIEPKLDVWSSANLEDIDSQIEMRRNKFDVIVVDTPGKTGDAVTSICLLSDLVIIPLQTSKRDLRQAEPVVRRILTVQKATAGKPNAALVLNFTRRRDVSARIYRRALEPLGLPVAATEIRRLDSYKDSDTVMRDASLSQDSGADDIRKLVGELIAPVVSKQRAANG